jgi:hypothetical protein
MSNGEYRNIGGKHVATDGTVVRNDETFTPTDRELEAFGDKFEKVGDEADSRSEPADEDDTSEDADTYTESELSDKEYSELRSIAGAFDDVDGRNGKDKLVEALAGRRRVDVEE